MDDKDILRAEVAYIINSMNMVRLTQEAIKDEYGEAAGAKIDELISGKETNIDTLVAAITAEGGKHVDGKEN